MLNLGWGAVTEGAVTWKLRTWLGVGVLTFLLALVMYVDPQKWILTSPPTKHSICEVSIFFSRCWALYFVAGDGTDTV